MPMAMAMPIKPEIKLEMNSTGLGWKVVPRLREYCRQIQAGLVSKSSNKIHQTWGPPFSRALYVELDNAFAHALHSPVHVLTLFVLRAVAAERR